MGFEAHPNQYQKKYDSEGVIYERKPEYRAEQEERLRGATDEEREAEARAIQKKRAERRTTEMTPAEQLAALAKARMIADWVEETEQKVC